MTTAAIHTPLQLEVAASKQLSQWLFEQKISLIFTTYQTNKIFWVGVNPQGKLSIFERTFERGGALHAQGRQTVYLSTQFQIWRFENALTKGKRNGNYDGVLVPQVAWTTGALEIHDLDVTADGTCLFANTRFSCISKVSDKFSFVPVWKPFFITQLTPEDRCHLSGFVCENGKPAFATAYGKTNTFEGWRENVSKGGVVIDVASNTLVSEGLSMPHSPVLHQGKLYLLNAGTGEFGYIDLKNGKFTPIAFCPGFARGLAIIDRYAIIGISKIRAEKSSPLNAVQQRLEKSKPEHECGLQIIDLQTGKTLHSLHLQGVVQEIFDVVYLEDIFCPSAIGILNDEICHTITIGEFSFN